ncbi:unnamed protein product [Rangifer tarandus platyrhynchus]|uniref:Uncharacterized protein n=1 Tax=Rangifer tarandus platyrhynchus TaxID=3082113 RepID=A0AC60A3V2_RANTA
MRYCKSRLTESAMDEQLPWERGLWDKEKIGHKFKKLGFTPSLAGYELHVIGCGFGWALQAGARTNNAAGACIRVITTLQESPVPLTLSALFLLRGAFPSSRSRAFGLRFTLTRPIISKKCSTVPKKSRALGEVGVLERLRKMTGYPGFLAGLLRRSLHQGPSAAH